MKIFYWMTLVASLIKTELVPNIIIKNSEPSSLFFIVCRIFLLAFVVSACAPIDRSIEHEFSGQIMGTYFRITVVADGEIDLALLEAGIQDSMQAVNQSMSNYIDDSEINLFNRMPARQTMQLSPIFSQVIRESLAISELTDGAFDVTISPLINAWGFGEQGSIEQQPSQHELKSLAAVIGYEKLSLEQNLLSKLVDGVEVNVSAIAKGYAVDRVAEFLLDAGFSHFLVDIGGEVRAHGRNGDNETWRIAIEKPTIVGGVQQVVELENQALATSGDYRNFLLLDGKQFSHTINPVTLTPALHKLASVSVLADNCSSADALATALMVMGEERGLAFATDNKIPVYMLVRTDQPGQYSILMTEEFRRILQ